MNLLDHLQEQGYEPRDEKDPHGGNWFDLISPAVGAVRVVLYPADGYRAEVYLFDAHMVCEWDAKFSPGTPDAAITAVAELAEERVRARRRLRRRLERAQARG
jgi:hypothetical protein